MKWYETPVEELYNRAILALGQNDTDAYRENLVHAYTLIRERSLQTIDVLDKPDYISKYYQGLDALLHMEQSKLRTMKDDVLKISYICLMVECACVRNRYKDLKCHRQIAGLYKQAIGKMRVEMIRRTRVYGLVGAGCIFDEYITLHKFACSDKNGALYVRKYEERKRLCKQLLCRLQREQLRRASRL